MNHGEGYGLGIPVSFKFLGPVKAIQWTENAVKKLFKLYIREQTIVKNNFLKKIYVFLRENCPAL